MADCSPANYSPSLPKASEASGRRPDHALNVALEGVSRPPTLGPSPGVLLADIGAIIRTPHDVALKGGGRPPFPLPLPWGEGGGREVGHLFGLILQPLWQWLFRVRKWRQD